MKKSLFFCTALLGASALAPAVMAEDLPAGKLQLKLGGYVEFQAGFFGSKLNNETNREFVQKAQLTVDGEAKTDNGLSYGPHIEIRENPDSSPVGGGTGQSGSANASNGSSLRFTQTWLHVAGNFGRFEIGDRRGPGFLSAVSAPYVGFGGLVNSNYDSLVKEAPTVTAGSLDYSFVRPANSNRSTKVAYYTPAFSGFQAGLSYAPEINKGDSTVVQNGAAAGTPRYTDVIEGTVTYKGEFSGVAVSSAINVNHLSGYGRSGTSKLKDSTPIYGGLKLSYAGFSLGGGAGTQDGFAPGNSNLVGNTGAYTYKGSAFGGDAFYRVNTFYNVGATYQTGPYGVGVTYGAIETNRKATNSTLNVGLAYNVTPGLVLGADYFHTEYDAVLVNGSPTQTDKGDYFILSSRINF